MKDKLFTMRISKEDLELLNKKAKEKELNMSSYVKLRLNIWKDKK